MSLADRKFPEILNLPQDLAACHEAARISLDTLSREHGELKGNLRKLELELEHFVEATSPTDRFQRVFSTFAIRVKAELDVFETTLTSTTSLYKTMVAYFGEDPVTCGPEIFFGFVETFCESFLKAKKDAEDNLKRELKQQAKQKHPEEKQKEKRETRRKLNISSAGEEEEAGILDDLLESLKTAPAPKKRSISGKVVVREESAGNSSNNRKKSMRQAKKRGSMSPMEGEKAFCFVLWKELFVFASTLSPNFLHDLAEPDAQQLYDNLMNSL